MRTTLGRSNSEIEEYWDAHGAGAGEFMQLLDWAELDTEILREKIERVSMPTFVDDSATSCLVTNSALRDTFGISEDNVRDGERLLAANADRQSKIDSLRENLWASGEAYSATVELKCKDSGPRWFWIRSTPLENSAGEVVRSVGIVIDIHERVLDHLESESSESQVRALLDNLGDPVVAIDLDQKIQIWNKAAAHMFGYSASEAIGNPISMLLDPEVALFHSALVAGYFHSDDGPRLMHNNMVSFAHRDGTPIRAEINLSKMTLDGIPVSVATIRDVDARANLLELQSKADQKFAALIERSEHAILILDETGRISYASPAIEKLSGYTPAQTVGRSLAVTLSNIHPEDRTWVEERTRSILLERGVSAEWDYRQVSPDGTVRYVSARISNYLDVEGIAGLVFNLRDITEAKVLGIRIEQQNQELKAILAAFPDLLNQISPEGIVVRCLTPQREAMIEAMQVVGESLSESMPENTGAEFDEVVARVSVSQEAELLEFTVPSGTGSAERCIEARISPLPNGDVLGSFRDVSSEKKLQRQLLHQTLHDDLTGLPNRSLLASELGSAIEGSEDQSASVAVLFLDLDGFKAVNDQYGHSFGDELLVAVASRLATIVRPGDMVSRIGGDEFIILCSALHHQHDAEALADRICLAMGAPFQVAGKVVSIGASIGIAFADESGIGVEALIRRADTAMYIAKELGRGRSKVFDKKMS